ncbi:uncharacterized protein BDR25DRAFT_311322 [Lindgomyces ingoldianus]|uniref:Uncharacterized protein n=1 Tax=Lindgomyces ingoldianus TaxID=673940 RepID=A0ACB6R850_9PLEO|nr:uncharacterized protein BDR25DRAFT_311322 [Lindgomyces ingoldianus]KAF2474925.1 hypothetical protein BDR25DRAFT_311322 [Lindgomyces ingoldianus]
MAPLFKITAFLGLSLLVASQGTQFITGPCQSDAECASGCCGFNTGKCAGPVVAQQRDGGCGFGDPTPNANAAIALGFQPQSSTPAQALAAPAPTTPAPSGANGAGNGQGTQFITGACTSDKDCGSGCCGFKTGKCAGAVVAQERDGGCGFGDAQPNANAAAALGFTGTPGGGAAAQAQAPAASAAPAPAAGNNGNVGTGTQFITGPCTSDADCASGCCGFKSGKCAGAIVAQERDGGCGFGNPEPNDNAAQALRGQRLGKRGVVYWM